MNQTENDVDADIRLDSLAPPTYEGRALQWSGEDGVGRVPELGEAVRWEEGPLGLVVGYFPKARVSRCEASLLHWPSGLPVWG